MTKLEEVARHICQKQMERWDYSAVPDYVENNWRKCLPDARAAVESLKEPNDSTRNALSRACSTDCFMGCNCGEVWDAGIDAILNETIEETK